MPAAPRAPPVPPAGGSCRAAPFSASPPPPNRPFTQSTTPPAVSLSQLPARDNTPGVALVPVATAGSIGAAGFGSSPKSDGLSGSSPVFGRSLVASLIQRFTFCSNVSSSSSPLGGNPAPGDSGMGSSAGAGLIGSS